MAQHEQHSDAIKAFGAEVRRRREAAGLSLAAFNKRSGVSPTYLMHVERGLRDPSLATIEKIARGLGVSPGELLGAKARLSPRALEAAELFDGAAPEIQIGVLGLLEETARLGRQEVTPAPAAPRPRARRATAKRPRRRP